jgi:hypothetical protein
MAVSSSTQDVCAPVAIPGPARKPVDHRAQETCRTSRAVTGLGQVRKTCTIKCTGTGGIMQPFRMTGMKIGYARVSTNDQDLTGQRNALLVLGVEEKQIFVDHGLTGSNRVHLHISRTK